MMHCMVMHEIFLPQRSKLDAKGEYYFKLFGNQNTLHVINRIKLMKKSGGKPLKLLHMVAEMLQK